jgi:hypothetical protein
MFDLSLEDHAFEPLGLSFEEHEKVRASCGPSGFILERWGESFTRLRVIRREPDYEERIIDLYPPDDLDYKQVVLWQASLEDGRFAPSVKLEISTEGELCLAAHGGRFLSHPKAESYDGGSPDGPSHRLPLFTLKIPLGGFPSRNIRQRDYSILESHLVPSQPHSDYFWVHGRDTYEHEDQEKGIWWRMAAYDLRPRLEGAVARIKRTLWRRDIKTVTVRLLESEIKVDVDPGVIEPTYDGRAVPQFRGHSVSVVLGSDFAPERVWMA